MEKDIRFIAVDYADKDVQSLMRNPDSAYTELDKSIFDNHSDGIFTGSETFDNITMVKGRLLDDPQVYVNHSNGDTKFVFAKLVVRDGYYDLKGNHHDHSEFIPLRFFKHLDQIMLAKKGDALQVTGSLKTFLSSDVADQKKAADFFYVSVKSFGIMFGSAIRKQVKAKFEPRQQQAVTHSDDLVSMITNASPEERAKILNVLQGKNSNQGGSNVGSSTNISPRNPQPQENDNHVSDIPQEDLMNAYGEDF